MYIYLFTFQIIKIALPFAMKRESVDLGRCFEAELET